MTALVIHALWLLFLLERSVRADDFPALMARLQRTHINALTMGASSMKQLTRAMDIACALYFHRVLCLQRSAATAMLLRSRGIRAELLLGVRVLPFKSHAWVEVDGRVVNDRPDVATIYQPLERC